MSSPLARLIEITSLWQKAFFPSAVSPPCCPPSPRAWVVLVRNQCWKVREAEFSCRLTHGGPVTPNYIFLV